MIAVFIFEPNAASENRHFRGFYQTISKNLPRFARRCLLFRKRTLASKGGIRLIGFGIGLVCGAIELFLLKRLTLTLQQGKSLQTLGIILLKMLLYAGSLVPVALFFRNDLVWCGVGITSVLIIGAVVLNILSRRNGKGDR